MSRDRITGNVQCQTGSSRTRFMHTTLQDWWASMQHYHANSSAAHLLVLVLGPRCADVVSWQNASRKAERRLLHNTMSVLNTRVSARPNSYFRCRLHLCTYAWSDLARDTIPDLDIYLSWWKLGWSSWWHHWWSSWWVMSGDITDDSANDTEMWFDALQACSQAYKVLYSVDHYQAWACCTRLTAQVKQSRTTGALYKQ